MDRTDKKVSARPVDVTNRYSNSILEELAERQRKYGCVNHPAQRVDLNRKSGPLETASLAMGLTPSQEFLDATFNGDEAEFIKETQELAEQVMKGLPCTPQALIPCIPLLICKTHPNAIIPEYATDGSVGMDLHSIENRTVAVHERILVRTGLSIALPPGYEAQIRPRSGNAWKQGVTVLNSPGTIDWDYRGEIMVCLTRCSNNRIVADNRENRKGYIVDQDSPSFAIRKGDRIAQMVIAPVLKAQLIEVDSLNETIRGAGGYGSTGD